MPLCLKCARNVCNPCILDAANDNVRKIVVTPVNILRRPAFIHQLAKNVCSLGLSGEGTVDWLHDQIHLEFEGVVIGHDGLPLPVGDTDIEDSFGMDSRRWVNDFKRSEERMPRQKLQARCVARVMYIELAWRIAND